jgi:hypothetical protein
MESAKQVVAAKEHAQSLAASHSNEHGKLKPAMLRATVTGAATGWVI